NLANPTLFAVASSTSNSTTTLFSIMANGSSGAVFNLGARSTTTIPNNTKYAWTLATSTTATPLLKIDTTTGSEGVTFGGGSGDVIIGDVGLASNLVFEESSTIHGQGGNTLTFGQTGDKLNFAVNTGFGSSTPYARLSIHANNGDTANTLFAIASSTQ